MVQKDRFVRILALGLVVFGWALFVGSGVSAQEGSASFPSKPPAELYIRNTTGQAMIFSAAVDDSDFAEYTVNPGSSYTISCTGSGCGDMGYFHIRIGSNIDGRVTTKAYSETPGTRVQIAWNDRERCWDFYKDN